MCCYQVDDYAAGLGRITFTIDEMKKIARADELTNLAVTGTLNVLSVSYIACNENERVVKIENIPRVEAVLKAAWLDLKRD